MPANVTLDAFAIAAPGLAPLVADELRALDIAPTAVVDAGVSFQATRRELYRANVQLRIASRVVVRLGDFKAAHFTELEKGARGIDWSTWIAPGTALALRVTCRKSRLYHSGAVAERLVGVISTGVRGVTGNKVTDDDDREGPGALLLVRIDRDRCTLSLDSSGALLHRRGYRQAVARAPLRETLAAAMLRSAGWTGAAPLVDPLCGSGTLPIEAALLARCIAPGINRQFGFQEWPSFDRKLWDRVIDEARSAERPASPVAIHGSDRDAGAIESAMANAARAGVAGDITFARQALSRVRPPAATPPGLLVSNPPWGERVGEAKELRNLYASFGSLAVQHFGGWTTALLTSSEMLRAAVGLEWRTAFHTTAGGIRVTFSIAEPS